MKTTPSAFYVTPRISVDEYRGQDMSADDAALMVESGCKVRLRDESVARDVLSILGLSPEEVEERITFGKTGHL